MKEQNETAKLTLDPMHSMAIGLMRNAAKKTTTRLFYHKRMQVWSGIAAMSLRSKAFERECKAWRQDAVAALSALYGEAKNGAWPLLRLNALSVWRIFFALYRQQIFGLVSMRGTCWTTSVRWMGLCGLRAAAAVRVGGADRNFFENTVHTHDTMHRTGVFCMCGWLMWRS
jgi:hypothetical protein